jgi:hypothetical protein
MLTIPDTGELPTCKKRVQEEKEEERGKAFIQRQKIN